MIDFHTKDAGEVFINPARVQRLQYSNNKGYTLVMEDDGVREVHGHPYDVARRLSHAGRTVMPALPGWYLLVVWENTDGWWLSKTPIIGWRIESDEEEASIAVPVLMESQEGAKCQAILSPDGLITVPMCSEFDSLEEFIKDTTEDLKKPMLTKETSGKQADAAHA